MTDSTLDCNLVSRRERYLYSLAKPPVKFLPLLPSCTVDVQKATSPPSLVIGQKEMTPPRVRSAIAVRLVGITVLVAR